jgi:CRP-like cAMP-binding protein
VSLLTVVDERSALEIGVVGRDGMVGLDLALGVGVSPVRAVVQRAGTAIRMSAAHFRKEFQASQPMRQLVHGYASGLMSQIAQTAACNRFHDTQKRLARRLLVMRDQVHSDHFYMTHDSLGTVLGVRRVGVTQAAHALKQQGLIDYSRGNIDILDGPGLEAVACSCYLTARVRRGKAGD